MIWEIRICIRYLMMLNFLVDELFHFNFFLIRKL